jgi:metal-sulfur cluster biosynthetic enzyme
MKEKIIEKLKEIEDPEIGIDIVNLGLIRNVKVNEVIEIDFLPTSLFCPYLDFILEEIKEKLKKEFKKDVKINIVWDIWSKDLMSEEAKRKLGIK